MTKRDLVIRISNETGLVQQQVLDVIQKTLDYISAAVATGRTSSSGTSACALIAAERDRRGLAGREQEEHRRREPQ